MLQLHNKLLQLLPVLPCWCFEVLLIRSSGWFSAAPPEHTSETPILILSLFSVLKYPDFPFFFFFSSPPRVAPEEVSCKLGVFHTLPTHHRYQKGSCCKPKPKERVLVQVQKPEDPKIVSERHKHTHCYSAWASAAEVWLEGEYDSETMGCNLKVWSKAELGSVAFLEEWKWEIFSEPTSVGTWGKTAFLSHPFNIA